jgi:hypothetical protein
VFRTSSPLERSNPDTDGRSISRISREPAGRIENTQTIFSCSLESWYVGRELA